MSRDRRGNGVQVVAGSNPACPTKPNHSRSISYRIILTHTASVASLTPRLVHAYSQRFGIRFLSDLLASDDGEFGKFATEWRITKRHMRTSYTIGDPAQKAIVGRIS